MRDAAAIDLQRQRFQPRDQIGPDQPAGFFLADVHIVAALGLGGRREDRLGQAIGFAQARRQRDAADLPGLLIFLPARSRQVAARHAFDRHRLGAADQHGPAPQLIRVLAGGLGERVHVHRDQVMRDEIAHAAEPEAGELREHAPLVRDARPQHVVEGGDPVGGDDEQLIADLVDVAHFAAAVERQAFEIGVEERCRG